MPGIKNDKDNCKDCITRIGAETLQKAYNYTAFSPIFSISCYG
jgi:hypothetical protein